MTRQPSQRPATLADVARLAGVSSATVSRCLNASAQVQPETRSRVQAAIEELGYRPNHSARALAARRTGMIGAVIPTMDNAIFARGIQAFQEALDGMGHTLLVASSAYRTELEQEQIETLVARGADGLLLIGSHRPKTVLDWLERRRVPTLISWATAPDNYPLPSVGFDNRAAMAMLVRRVLELGHRRIGVISAPAAANDRAAERLAAIHQVTGGIAGISLDVIETPYGYDTGSAAFARLMRADARATAVLCGNDVLAAGAVQEARRQGLSVPGDVSITGFDDIEIATLLEPGLTTVHVPHREMGQRAADVLVGMVRGDAITAQNIELPVELKLRGTLGPV